MEHDAVVNLRIVSKQRLEKLGVGLAYLFGSRAEGVAGPLSDTDIGIVFADPRLARGDTRAVYNTLYDLFSPALGSGNIDVVFLERAGLELCFDVITHGKIIFSVSDEFRENFEHRIAMLYADFRPILENFNRATLARVP